MNAKQYQNHHIIHRQNQYPLPIHYHDHFTFSELEQREGGNGLESSQDPEWTSCDIVTQVTSPRRHNHSNFDIGTNMIVIIFKILMAGTMMIIKVTKGATEKI